MSRVRGKLASTVLRGRGGGNAAPLPDVAAGYQVRETASAVRAMLAGGELPAPTLDVRRCKGCSLRERCQPQALARLRGADFARAPFDPDA